ncbi:hypothetical protein [Streptomyces viridochromogenes]|uniref:hypothetical protein n=1 Tax=Streptomyces viridochromogenes TaxID=1938 RepID=UPI00069D656B|nr:hypothetical protein [Streptomyces viridochromogenes]KOG07677.1 hypothetical protein ADK35_43760 [Streptomyces viridochromogenes]KOG12819.1 hypothetical protein ADK36_34780 [Streptomyces viridochromogenes]
MGWWEVKARWLLLAAGLCATAIELGVFGLADVSNALTYAGRLNGVIFLAGALLEVAAAVALNILRKSDPANISAVVVLVGVLVSLLVNVVLLILQLDGWSYTHYLWVWALLLPWSLWALWELHRLKVWSRIPHAEGIAVGVIITGVLAVANFTYTQIYQPYTSKAMLTNSVEFGKATVAAGGVSVPVRLRTRNTGQVGVYVLGSLYQVSGRRASFVPTPRKPSDWFHDFGSGQRDFMRYTNVKQKGYELLAQGQFISRSGPVHVLEPGAEVLTEKIVQFPAGADFEALGATANVTYVRRDRVKIIDDFVRSGRSSWTKKYKCCSEHVAPPWVAKGVHTIRFQSRITHSNALLENTRAPYYATLWWVLTEPPGESAYGPELKALIGPEGAQKNEPTPTEVRQMKERYGLAHAPSGTVLKAMAQLLKPESEGQ